MRNLSARDAISNRVVQIAAEQRISELRWELEEKRVTHLAVFDGNQFCGVVPLHEVAFSNPDRIAADLVPSKSVPTVSEETPIEEVAALIDTNPSGIAIVNAVDGRFLGIATQQSVLQALLRVARQRTIEQTEHAEQRFHELMESAPDAMLVVDQTGNIVQANAAALQMFGYSSTELIGMSVNQLVPSEIREKHQQHLSMFFFSPSRRPMGKARELVGLHRDGTEFPVEISLNPLVSGQETVATAAIRDVTVRRQAEQELRNSEERFRQLAEHIHEVFWVSDRRSGLVTYVSPAYEEIWQRSAESLYQEPTSFLDAIHPEDRERVRETLLRQQQGNCTDEEYRVVRPDGTTRWVRDRGFPIVDASGEVYRVVGIADDVTEWKRASSALRVSNQQLQEALDELQQAQSNLIRQERLRALGEMAGGIAHDLNNTLSPIVGYAELLAADIPERHREYIQHIQLAACDAAAVVDRLREFCRPQGMGTQTLGQSVNLAEILKQIPELTRPKWRDEAQRSGRAIELTVEADIPVWVRGSAPELRDVMINLIFNAVDALPSGGRIVLRLSVTPPNAVLEVSDTGIGMTEDVVSRCFEPFFSTKGPEGTGLGLSVCHGIMQRHGGCIEVDSRPGDGTTMRLLLPLSATDASEESGPAQISPVPLSTSRILYIDDDARLLNIVSNLLVKLGHSVDVASHGTDGLSLFRQRDYDIVITDRAMPGIDGREVTRIIKALRPNVPVILVSGWNEDDGIDNGAVSRPDLLLGKPLTLQSLREALAKVQAAVAT